jgi:hypothetical protein
MLKDLVLCRLRPKDGVEGETASIWGGATATGCNGSVVLDTIPAQAHQPGGAIHLDTACGAAGAGGGGKRQPAGCGRPDAREDLDSAIVLHASQSAAKAPD